MSSLSDALRYQSADGLDIHYWVTWNKGLTRPFVVLHPASSLNHTSLSRLEGGLHARGHPTLTFDPRGSGHSGHPIPRKYFRLDRVTGDLEGILRQEGLERPRILAHSFGFMPAVDYAVRTGNVAHITGICASHNFSQTASHKALFYLFDRFLIYSEFLGRTGMNLSRAVRGTHPPEYLDQSGPFSSDYALWKKVSDISFTQAACHVIGQREVNTWDITPQLRMLHTPLLLIYGSKDVMVRPKGGDCIRRKTVAPCTVEIVEGGTHALPVREPGMILDIFDRHSYCPAIAGRGVEYPAL